MIDLADYQVLLGDCTKLMPQLPPESYDALITDPPFNVLNKADIRVSGRSDIKRSAFFDQFETYGDYIDFTKSWVTAAVPLLKKNATMYVFFAGQYVTDLLRICKVAGMEFFAFIPWHKTNPAPQFRKVTYVSSVEVVLVVKRGKPTFNFLGQNSMHNFIETSLCSGGERVKDANGETLHATQKPVSVIEWMLKVCTRPGDRILDPFAGVGTTIAACKHLGRLCTSIEVKKEYRSAALARLSKESPRGGRLHKHHQSVLF